MKLSFTSCLAATLLTATMHCDAVDFAPGVEMNAVVPSSGKRIVVTLPAQYDPSRKWPVVCHFHGMGGQPDTSFLQALGAGQDNILVGMSYLERRESDAARETYDAYMAREDEHFRATLAWLREETSIDTGRVYLSGISKGGWHAAALGEREADNLAGLVILLAGRQPMPVVGAVPPGLRGMPVYVGVGENDPNVVAGLRARLAYGQAGAFVTFDLFEGLGHQLPETLPRLQAWFTMQQQVVNRSVPDDARAALTGECQAEYEAAMSIADVKARYSALRRLGDDPRLPWCGDSVYRGVWKMVSSVGSSPDAGRAWLDEQQLLSVVTLESNINELRDYETIIGHLTSLQQGTGQTLYARIGERLIEPYQDAYKRSVEATMQANEPRPPPSGNTSAQSASFGQPVVKHDYPRRIIRRGNKIIFERGER